MEFINNGVANRLRRRMQNDQPLQQAGAAQQRDHMGAGFIESQFNSLKKGTVGRFGDEWDDYENIKLGYKLYMEGYFCD